LRLKTCLFLIAVLIPVLPCLAADTLEATFNPSSQNPLPEVPFYFTVQVSNKGAAVSTGNRVSVSRFTVASDGQIGTFGTKLGGFSGQAINDLAPGQSANFEFSDQRPGEGAFVYRISFSNPGNYKTKEMQVTFARQQPATFAFTGPGTAPAEVNYVLLNPLPKPNQPFSFTVKATNKGAAKILGTKLTISRHTVSTGGFIDNAGSPIGSQNIPALAPGESANLPFNDPNPPEGKFVYRMQVADAGVFRLQEMTVTFSKGSQVIIR